MFLSLHTADDAPISKLVRHSKRHGFRAIFRNSILVMLASLIQFNLRPEEPTPGYCPLNFNLQVRTGRMAVLFERKPSANHNCQRNLRRKAFVHFAEKREIDIHAEHGSLQ